jgi:hypothetical protein
VTDPRRRVAQRFDLGVGGRVAALFAAITAATEHGPFVSHDDRSDGHVTGRSGQACFVECERHQVFVDQHARIREGSNL